MSLGENIFGVGPGSSKPIDLGGQWERSLIRPLGSLLKKPLERIFAISRLNDAYRQTSSQPRRRSIFAAWLDTLKITYRVCGLDLAKIPSTGPLVITANHPFGGLEGIILGDILTRLRPDVKILGNHLLSLIPELEPYLIGVNVFEGKNSAMKNGLAIKSAIRWLRDGGCLITFPAGTVSHFQFSEGKSADPTWSRHVGAIIRRSAATVVPAFFPGRNSMIFQTAGFFNARLRTALLPHELMNKCTKDIGLQFGHPIAWGKLQGLADDQTRMNHLRVKTYLLENRQWPSDGPQHQAVATAAPVNEVPHQPPPGSIRDGCWEIAGLPPENLLAANRQFEVYLAKAMQIPGLLLQIGELRERTFRKEGEGTGKKTDLDRFDLTYSHLILWDKELQRPAGAYRFCQADHIVTEAGVDGLYTHSLFKFKKGFFEQAGPALELGRSFIRPAYQGNPLCLSLLWQAIGTFIGRNPQYSTLFGPVTISNSYHSVSKTILVDFLLQTCRNPRLSHYVKPRTPFRHKRRYGVSKKLLYSCLCTIDDVANIIRQVERDQKGVPILLRHYLKLNASFVDFNIDENFSNAIDGLMVVDLRTTPERYLVRFMGKEGYQNFLSYHKSREDTDSLDRAI